MKTVGIIGGSGFIGSHTTKKFLKEGYQVKVSVIDPIQNRRIQTFIPVTKCRKFRNCSSKS